MASFAPFIVFALLAAPALRLAGMPGKAERWAAVFFLASACGLSFRLLGVADGVTDSSYEIAVNALGHAALSASCVALFVFTRTVFRPTAQWARWTQHLGTLASIGSLVFVFIDGGYADEQALSVPVANAIRTASYSWCFIESLRYWRMMRRRVGLGLAEPIVANRFALWSVWTGGLMGCLGLVLVTRVAGALLGVGMDAAPRIMGIVRFTILLGVAATMTAIWLSFFPPSRYVDWIEKRASA